MDLKLVRNIMVVCAVVAIAVNSACLPAAAGAALTPGTPVTPAPGVPSHGRAWERVTPPEPTGSSMLAVSLSVAPDGNRILYRNIGLMPGFPYGNPFEPLMIATRHATGWSVTQPVGPTPNQWPLPFAFGPDETAIWTDSAYTGDGDLYFGDRDGQFQKLAEESSFVAASPDLRRLVFASAGHFLPADASRTAGSSIYERDGSGLRLLDAGAGGELLSSCGSSVKAAATDARRVYFTAQPNCEGTERLYLAELGTGVREASASRCSASCGEATRALFVSTTRDGSNALFTTGEKLLDEDENSHDDLYRYDAEDDDLTLVSSGQGGVDLVPKDNPLEGSSSIRWAVASANGSRVYFFAAEQISPDETSIYLADANGVSLLASAATTTLVNVSADGRYALMNSTAPLAPGDSDGLTDVYRYDAVSGDFTRLSQGPLGGNGAFAAAAETDDSAKFGPSGEPLFRAMLDDGSGVFFNTDERLLPEDTNGLGDVYEWANGNLGLVSSGVGKFPALLLTTTPDGATVVFKTADALLPSDRDGNETDYYAARTGGGFAEEPPPPDACPCREPVPARKQLDAAVTKPAASEILLPALGAAERRRIVRTGWIELLAEVPGSGRLAAEARARLGRRTVTVASTGVQVAEPGPVQLRMRLSKAARKHLAAGKGLSLQLRVRLAGEGKLMRLQLKGRR